MKSLALMILTGILTLLSVAACTGSGSGSSASTSNTYQGAGSRWTASIDQTTFTLTKYASAAADASVSLTISGTVVRNSTNLFLELTVTSASGAGAPSAGDKAYGLEIPGTAFFLKPVGATAEPIIMVKSGTCPSSNFDANWIIAKPRSDFTPPLTATSDFFGSAGATISGAGSSLSVQGHQPITGATVGAASNLNFDIANCSNGLLRVADNAEFFDMYFTASNNVLVKFPSNTGNQIIFGSARQTTAVTQSTVAATYSAIVFEDKSGGDSMFPAVLTIPTAGNATGYAITDVVNNTVDTDGIVLSNIASVVDSTATQLPNGFFRADLNAVSGATNGKVTCAYSTSDSTKVLACSGYMNNAGGDARRPFFFLGRSR